MKSWTEWLIGIIAIAGAVGLLIALMLYNPADSPTQQEHMIVTPAVTAPPQVKASVVTPEVKPVEMPPEPQTATESDLTVEEEEIYADEETVTESEYKSLQEEVQVEEDVATEPLGSPNDDSMDEDAEDDTGSGESTGQFLGVWTITAYCDCEICTGQWSGSPTASGAWPSEGWTIACGSLPFGTMVYIEGVGTRCVEDRGVDGEWIDVYFEDHDTADSFGMQYLDVYLVE